MSRIGLNTTRQKFPVQLEVYKVHMGCQATYPNALITITGGWLMINALATARVCI